MTLRVEDVAVGWGKMAVAGQELTVHYQAWLSDGTLFDSSIDRKQPLTFVLGAGQVIAGWDIGLAGMREGGKRSLFIPAAMAYGQRAVAGVIPKNADLMFEVDLIKAS